MVANRMVEQLNGWRLNSPRPRVLDFKPFCFVDLPSVGECSEKQWVYPLFEPLTR